ncbi:MAG: hypothetical protein Q9227_006700 [Pyrenula ochraceoflavens]
MFSSTSLFKNTPCPLGQDCTLLNCIFSHDTVHLNGKDDPASSKGIQTLPDKPDVSVEPPTKRRRLMDDEQSLIKNHAESSGSAEKSTLATKRQLTPPSDRREKASSAALKQKAPVSQSGNNGSELASVQRPISPPPTKSAEKFVSKFDPSPLDRPTSQATASRSFEPSQNQKPKEVLNPRSVLRSPAQHPTRLRIVQQLHAALVSLNEKTSKQSKKPEAFVLSDGDLVSLALDEEENVAKTGSSVYANIVKQRIVQLRKMSLEDWEKLVLARLQRNIKPRPNTSDSKAEKTTQKSISSGLTAGEELQVLRKMRKSLAGLESFGYVTSPPSTEEIESARAGIKAANGFEKCDRCGTRFQVFPGRREEDGALTTNGTCTYHWERIQRPQSSRTDAITGHREPFYPCCKEPVGISAGCTTSPHHVFKVAEVKRLASILQFAPTPEPNFKSKPAKNDSAVTFDCEMGYTTLGMEIIRVTAVSWPAGQRLLDVLVRPMGELLDPNTRFSGVSREQLATARPYGEPVIDESVIGRSDNVLEDGELDQDKPSPLRIASSPSAARQLLFGLLSPETPLIGHAIENDLNAMRIIHPFVVDTVLLFPHPKGLPIRYKLKMLAAKYLQRDIQTGGAQGHDSKEDAQATGDLVRLKVGERWNDMKTQGWCFKDGVLTEVEPGKVIPRGSHIQLGAKRDAGQVDSTD